MLGRLARWLRLLGQDVLYFREVRDSSLLRVCLEEPDRVLLTRDTRLMQTRPVRNRLIEALLIESDEVEGQLEQVVRALRLRPGPPRCSVDNEELQTVPKEEVQGRVPEYVFKTQECFEYCPSCGRIYWPATHWGRIEEIRESLFSFEND